MIQPHVQIVIVNYNGKEMLKKYLPSVCSLEYSNYSITVVDNGSTDGSVEYIRSKFDDIKVVINSENLGFGAGNNSGVSSIKDEEYIWFLNNDVRVQANSLSKLVNIIHGSENIGIVGPRVNFANSDRIQCVGYEYDILGTTHQIDRGKTTPSNDQPHKVTGVVGAALLIRGEVWNLIGGFDEQNFLFGDDDYICLLSNHFGYDTVVVPNSVVYHEHGGSQSNSITPFIAYHYTRSQIRCHLIVLDKYALIFGILGVYTYIFGQMIKDLFIRRSFKLAMKRFYGSINPIVKSEGIVKKRKSVEKNRERNSFEVLDAPKIGRYFRKLFW